MGCNSAEYERDIVVYALACTLNNGSLLVSKTCALHSKTMHTNFNTTQQPNLSLTIGIRKAT